MIALYECILPHTVSLPSYHYRFVLFPPTCMEHDTGQNHIFHISLFSLTHAATILTLNKITLTIMLWLRLFWIVTEWQYVFRLWFLITTKCVYNTCIIGFFVFTNHTFSCLTGFNLIYEGKKSITMYSISWDKHNTDDSFRK